MADMGIKIDYDGISHVQFGGFVLRDNLYVSGIAEGRMNELYEEKANLNYASAIRPVVYLKTTIKTSGQDESGAWNIIDE